MTAAPVALRERHPKSPYRMRGNLSTEAGRGTAGCYVECPAQADSTRPPASPGVTAQRAGVDPLVPASVSAMLVARNLFPTGNATTVTGEPSL